MNFAAALRRKCPGRSLLRAENGAAALEFALVGPFFIFFVCVIIDLGLLLFTQSVLNNAVRDAARLVMTDQTGGSAASFSAKLCDDMGSLVSCSNLQYYVQSADSFSDMSTAVTTNASGNLANAGTFSPGSPGQDVVVQVAYNRPTLLPWTIPFVDGTSVTLSKPSNLLVATVAFQNEP